MSAAPVAGTGPPPGLGGPVRKVSGDDGAIHKTMPGGIEAMDTITKESSLGSAAALDDPRRYKRGLMLALSKSPLVALPKGMPPLGGWYGDWEPYHPRAQHHHGAAGMAPMGSIGSGARAERSGMRGHSGSNAGGGVGDDFGETGYGSSAVGLSGGMRGEKGGRFRRMDDREDGAMNARRFPPSGKNPFGQVSASGTFRPAGRENLEHSSSGRFGNVGRDPRAPLDDRRRGGRDGEGRDFGGLRDRRRDDHQQEEEEEWESVPRSPETERRIRAGHADAASDWRRSSASKQGAALGRERGGAMRVDPSRKTSFPAWMADEQEPSWMGDDGPQASGGGARRGQMNSDSRRRGGGSGYGAEADVDPDDIDIDTTGMDSIQAFKEKMKEKERRAREREQPTTAATGSRDAPPSSLAMGVGPPPGFAKKLTTGEGNAKEVDGSAALRSAGLSTEASQRSEREEDRSKANASEEGSNNLFDNFATSPSKQRAAQAEGDIGEPPGLPGRSSRFARFFDGKPQAAALAAQQKQLEARGFPGNADAAHSPASPHHQAAAAEGQQVKIDDLFSSMALGKSKHQQEQHQLEQHHPQQQQQQPHQQASRYQEQKNDDATPTRSAPPGLAPPTAPGGPQRNPSEADLQSMQKIMAVLGGNGGHTEKASAQEGLRSETANHKYQHQQQQQQQQQQFPAGLAALLGSGGGSGSGHNAGDHVSPVPRSHSPSMPFQASSDNSRGGRPDVAPQDWQTGPGQQPSQAQTQSMDSKAVHQESMPSPAFGKSPTVASPHSQGPPGLARGEQPPQQQQQHSPFAAHQAVGRPPFNMDPRLLGRPPMPPGGFPPHMAAAMNGMGPRGPPPPPPGMGAFPPGPPNGFPGPHIQPPPLGGLPPHLQQHLMTLPPHLQHHVLAQHFGAHFRGPPPQQSPSPQQQPQHQQPPYQYAGSPNPGANLMALLQQQQGGANGTNH